MMKEIVYTKKDFQNVKELWKNIQNVAVIINTENRSTIKKMLHNLPEMEKFRILFAYLAFCLVYSSYKFL